MVNLLAKQLEEGIKEMRKKNSEFEKLALNIMKKSLTDPSPAFLETFTRVLPPIWIGKSNLLEAKNLIAQLKESDLTQSEIIELSRRPIASNPLDLLNQKKKDVIVQAQSDLPKMVRRYCINLRDLHWGVANAPEDNLSDLFFKEQDFLPSYAKSKVSFTHLLKTNSYV